MHGFSAQYQNPCNSVRQLDRRVSLFKTILGHSENFQVYEIVYFHITTGIAAGYHTMPCTVALRMFAFCLSIWAAINTHEMRFLARAWYRASTQPCENRYFAKKRPVAFIWLQIRMTRLTVWSPSPYDLTVSFPRLEPTNRFYVQLLSCTWNCPRHMCEQHEIPPANRHRVELIFSSSVSDLFSNAVGRLATDVWPIQTRNK